MEPAGFPALSNVEGSLREPRDQSRRPASAAGGGTIWITVGKNAGVAPGFGFMYPGDPPQV